MNDTNDLLVTGSVALDTLETPFGNQKEVLGGSAAHFALGASLLQPVQLLSVVGQDFPEEYLKLFASRNIQTDYLDQQNGETFRWHGRYSGPMERAETIEIQQNVFEQYSPALTDTNLDPEVLFLGNSSPRYQRKILDQLPSASLVGADTMELWIETQRRELCRVMEQVDVFFLNYEEALAFGSTDNTVKAGKEILAEGPDTVVIKKGEHGALMMNDEEIFAIPGMPLEEVQDPTGAGDTFASGIMSYLSARARKDFQSMRSGLILGNVLASFTVEHFGPKGMIDLSQDTLRNRLEYYRSCTSLKPRHFDRLENSLKQETNSYETTLNT